MRYTKEDLDRIRRFCNRAGLLLSKSESGYKVQKVGENSFITLPSFDAVSAYICGYQDGYYETRVFVKRRMDFEGN